MLEIIRFTAVYTYFQQCLYMNSSLFYGIFYCKNNEKLQIQGSLTFYTIIKRACLFLKINMIERKM